jgi:hypothetical protein
MPSFTHTLIGLGPFADLGCKIVFTKTAATVFHPDGHPILAGWRDTEGPRLWHFPLQPNQQAALIEPLPPAQRLPCLPPASPAQGQHQHPNILQAINHLSAACSVTYLHGPVQALALAARVSRIPFDPRSLDLPSIRALLSFYRACLGFPVKQTWLDAIRAGNCDTFNGLTYSNAARYCPNADETIMGHLAQQRQNVRSTKPKPPATAPLLPAIPPPETIVASNLLVVNVVPLSKLYTDNTSRFPVRARSGNQYVMIAYHANGNLILQQEFQTKSDRHRIAAYTAIMTRLAAQGLSVDLQILDNEASSAYKQAITFTWKAKFQLVPPDMHRQNRAERAIRTFKDHFIAILAGVNSTFPPYLWDLLLPQAELTLNLLRQATLNPQISAWEYFQGPFDFNKTPLGPVGCRVLIHAKPGTRCSWDFRAKEGFYIGPALDSYRCFKLVKSDTRSQVISDMVEFRHLYITVPLQTLEDKIVHGLQVVAGAITGALPPTCISQLDAITNLSNLFESWRLLAPPHLRATCVIAPGHPRVDSLQPPRVATPAPHERSPQPVYPQRNLPASPSPNNVLATRLQSPRSARPPYQATPHRITFKDSPFPRVPAEPSPRVGIVPTRLPDVPPSKSPVQIPIAHRTRSRAPLALFTGPQPCRATIQHHIPTAKAIRRM